MHGHRTPPPPPPCVLSVPQCLPVFRGRDRDRSSVGEGRAHVLILPVRVVPFRYRTPAHEEPVVSPELVTPTLDAAKTPDADDADAEVWELQRKDMLLGNVLGVGHFGKVCMAKLRVPWGGEIDVAVKMAKADRMTSQAFLGEASKLKKLQHRNIVRVYGLCTTTLTSI